MHSHAKQLHKHAHYTHIIHIKCTARLRSSSPSSHSLPSFVIDSWPVQRCNGSGERSRLAPSSPASLLLLVCFPCLVLLPHDQRQAPLGAGGWKESWGRHGTTPTPTHARTRAQIIQASSYNAVATTARLKASLNQRPKDQAGNTTQRNKSRNRKRKKEERIKE